MGRKVVKYIWWEGVKLHSIVNGKEVRVAFDKGYGKKGGYRLYVDNVKEEQSTSKKKIAKYYFDYIDSQKTIELNPASVKNKITMEYFIIWVDINKSLEKIEEFVGDFIGYHLPDDTLEFTLDQIEDAIERAKSDKNYEPHIFNIKGDEIFICYNNKANRDMLLQQLVDHLNTIDPPRVASDIELIEKALLGAGTATKATLKKAKEIWGDKYDFLSDEEVKQLFLQNHKYEIIAGKICKIEPELDKKYILQELAKLLKKDKHLYAALSGIPELAHYDEKPVPEQDSDTENS